MRQGNILGGVICTPDLNASIEDYRKLGLRLVEQSDLDIELAQSWGCPANGGAPMATLQPQSGVDCFIRLVEAPPVPGFVPMRSHGWSAYELCVENVFALHEKVRDTGFEVVGPPKELPELPFFVPMQVTGHGNEMLYLNEIRMDTPDSDLPRAKSETDRIFIVILAAPDREKAVRWYNDVLGLQKAADYDLVYDLINAAFDLPPDTVSRISLVQNGRMPIVEIDAYPPGASERARAANSLPPGNALVSLAVDSLESVSAPFLAEPALRHGPVYQGRRSATLTGAAGELIELIETRSS